MSDEGRTRGRVRLEIVPFPLTGDELGSAEVEPEAHLDTFVRSKEATGWASSGLAGALRRQRKRDQG